MKIGITKDGLVSFTGMNRDLAEALIDIAEDLQKGNAVLLYGPDYVPVARPSDHLRNEFDRLILADAKMLGGLSVPEDQAEEDKKRFEKYVLMEETHIQVWNEIFPAPTTKEN